MRIETTRFGSIDINDSSVIRTPEGMLGFEDCKCFVLLEDQPGSCFKWLQSVDEPGLAFVVVNPIDFFPDYDVELTDEQADSLDLADAADAVMLTTVTINKEQNKVTTNLVGPLVINARTLIARQIVLDDERYTPKHAISRNLEICPERQRAAVA
jgi:flagellar assembly factor FliW